MNREYLLSEASKLIQPSKAATGEYSAKMDTLAEKVVNKLTARKDLDKLVGIDNAPLMKDNAHNMARFMESLFTDYKPAVLVETALWVFRAYRSHGFKLTFWSAHLNTWIEVIKEELPPEVENEIYPFFKWLQVNIPVFIKLTDKDVIPEPLSSN